MGLEITISEKNASIYIFKLAGELNTETAPQLEKEFFKVPEQVKIVILDMQNLNYITSLGISTIISANKTLENRGGKILLVNLPPQIKKVFDIIKALPSQRIYETLEELDAYLIEMQKKMKS